MTFRQWDERSCRLANALLGLGLVKGDRVAILAYNCVEWMEIYAATAKAGLVMVPINFRLLGGDIQYIVDNSEAEAVHRPARPGRPRGGHPSPICAFPRATTSTSAARLRPRATKPTRT